MSETPDFPGIQPDANPAGDATDSGAPLGFPSIIVQGAALSRIHAELSADTSAEVGGVLVGNAAPSTNFVLVTGSVAAPRRFPTAAPVGDAASDDIGGGAAADDTAFTVSAETLEDLARQVAVAYPGQRIVGWYHSHPGSGVFLAAHDVYIQSAFFAQPWQVNYVYDPIRRDGGFFGWSDRELVRIPKWEVTAATVATGAGLPVSEPSLAAPAGSALAATSASEVIGVSAPAATPTFAAPDDDEPGSARQATGRKLPVGALIGAAVAVLAVIVGVLVIGGGGDDDGATTTSSITVNSDETSTSASTPPSSSVDTSTSETTASTDTPSSNSTTTDVPSTDVPSTDPPEVTFPATPANVTAPAARVGANATACTANADGIYAPTSQCFVPLNNGGVMVFNAGTLRCVDPDGGTVLLSGVESFTIGVEADPTVLFANGALAPTCLDLSYVRNVLAEGGQTFDGLCGASGAQINDGTRRCLAVNATTGAVVAVVRDATDSTKLAQLCATGTEPEPTTLTWSNTDVSTAWRIDSVLYRAASNDYLATVSRNGTTATATLSCA